MVRFGGLLVFLGFVSAILHFTDIQFKILMWSEPMQPAIGLAIGCVGILVIVLRLMLSKKDDSAPLPAGVPDQQFAPQPGFQPQGPNSGPMPAMAPQGQPPRPLPGRPVPPQGPMQGRPMPQGPGPQGPQGPGPQGPQGPQGPMPGRPMPPQGYPQQQPGYGAPQGGFGPQSFGPQG